MAYCTKNDIREFLGNHNYENLSRSHDVEGETFDELVGDIISWVDSEIDSYLVSRYKVPLSVVDNNIKKCSVVMASYLLYIRCHQAEKVPDIKTGYDNAIAYLQAIKKGEINLPSVSQKDAITGEISGEERRFTLENLRGF